MFSNLPLVIYLLFLCNICVHNLFKPILNAIQMSFCVLQTSRKSHGKKKYLESCVR